MQLSIVVTRHFKEQETSVEEELYSYSISSNIPVLPQQDFLLNDLVVDFKFLTCIFLFPIQYSHTVFEMSASALVKSEIGWLDIDNAILVLNIKYGIGILHKGQQCFTFVLMELFITFQFFAYILQYCSVCFPQHCHRRYESSGISKPIYLDGMKEKCTMRKCQEMYLYSCSLDLIM